MRVKSLKSLTKKASVLGVSLVCCLALFGCSQNSDGYTGGVAATVNGTEIQEDTVTKYIQDYRNSANLTEDAAWATWLKQQSLEPSSLRQQVIDRYTEQELIKQAANEQEVSVDSSEVDSYIEKMKANYNSDEAWQTALESAGITEDEYKESVQNGLLEQALQEKVITDDQKKVSDEDLLKSMNQYLSMFNGAKRSSHILFASGDEDKAAEVLGKIKSGELDFAEAAKEYSTDTGSAENGGDVGWDKLSNFVTQYTTALSSLSKGEVSDLVTSDYGIHIIKCTDEFELEGEAKSLDDFPSEFVDYVRNMQESQNASTAFSEWLENYKNEADITVNDMPENVPYNVDMSLAEADSDTSTSSESSDATTTEEGAETQSDTSAAEEQTTSDAAADTDSANESSNESAN